jgi:uncharacterized membrane protein
MLKVERHLAMNIVDRLGYSVCNENLTVALIVIIVPVSPMHLFYQPHVRPCPLVISLFMAAARFLIVAKRLLLCANHTIITH